MTVRFSAGATIRFKGTLIPQVIDISVSEGETDVDGENFSDTSVTVLVMFDRAEAQHRITPGATGTIQIVQADGVSSFSIQNAEFVGRRIDISRSTIVVASLRFESELRIDW